MELRKVKNMDNERDVTKIVEQAIRTVSLLASSGADLDDIQKRFNETFKILREYGKKAEEKKKVQKDNRLKSGDEFKVGDRVIVHHVFEDQIGTIKYIASKDEFSFNTSSLYAIEFEKYPAPGYGHDCAGHCECGKGYWAAKHELEHYREPEFKIIIESKGDTTKAKLIHGKSVDKTAEVKRCSTDKYSEKDATKYVVAKLFGEKSAPAFPANGMIEWIDAKKNPPKESGSYLTWYGEDICTSPRYQCSVAPYSLRHKKWNCNDESADTKYAFENVYYYAKLNNPGEWNLIKSL